MTPTTKQRAARAALTMDSLIDLVDPTVRKQFYTEVLKGKRTPDGNLEINPQTGQPSQEPLEERMLALANERLNIRELITQRNADLERLKGRIRAGEEAGVPSLDLMDGDTFIFRMQAIRRLFDKVHEGKISPEQAMADLPLAPGPVESIAIEIAGLLRTLEAKESSIKSAFPIMEKALTALESDEETDGGV